MSVGLIFLTRKHNKYLQSTLIDVCSLIFSGGGMQFHQWLR